MTEVALPDGLTRGDVEARVEDWTVRESIDQTVAVDIDHHRLDGGKLVVREPLAPAEIAIVLKIVGRWETMAPSQSRLAHLAVRRPVRT